MAALKQSTIYFKQPQTQHIPRNPPHNQISPHLYQMQINGQIFSQIQQLQQQLKLLQQQHDLIKIFWDYENCPLWSSSFNSITKLYCDINRKIDSVTNKMLHKQWELYGPPGCLRIDQIEDADTLNIKVTLIASKYKEETVDKRIIADIGLFARHCAMINGIGHVVLISGDRDYGYILGSLKGTQNIGKIILCHNEQTRDTLLCHADNAFCLFANGKFNKSTNDKTKEDVLESKNDVWPTIKRNTNKNDPQSVTNSKHKRKKRGTRGRGRGKSIKDC